MTLQEALKQGEQYLQRCSVADASVDAWLLMEFVTRMSRAVFLAERQSGMAKEDYSRYQELLRRRGEHIPLQHLTGTQEFMGFSFLVNEHVLIPRQDTETLVEEALKRLTSKAKLLDMCTGSGCIAISLVKLCPGITADGADLSREALAVAEKNGRALEAEVRWLHSDLFSAVTGVYDMIVSNPPYIPTAVIEQLSEEVRLHEPHQALDGKEDGLYFYRRMVREGKDHLAEGGWLLFEIGYDQGDAVKELMRAEGYGAVSVVKDLAGHDRVVTGKK